MLHHSKKNLNKRGFTLIELLVSIAILTSILTVVVLNQSKYTDGIAISNAADELSLAVSQAQAYSIGVKVDNFGPTSFQSAYGLSFSLLQGSGGSNTTYLFFADRGSPPNMIYDYAVGSWQSCVAGLECVERFYLTGGNYIQKLCYKSGLYEDCAVGRIDLTFKRPTTDAEFIVFDTAGALISGPPITLIRVVIKSPLGTPRSILVYSTGQTSVNNTDGASCFGTPSACSTHVDQTNCGSAGCNWNPVGSCTGTYNCDQWDGTTNSQCRTNHNCQWTGGQIKDCYHPTTPGASSPCGPITTTSESTCEAAIGCTYVENYVCQGSPTSCPSISSASTCMANGCTWQ